MKELYLNVGAQIRFRDGGGGSLHKVVFDPHSQRLTALVVTQGRLQKHDHVIPISTVEKATPDEIQVALYAKEMASYPEFRQVEFDEHLDDWETEMIYPRESVLIWYPFGGVIRNETRVLPVIHRRIPQGISTDQQVMGRSSVVRNADGVVGKIDHLWLDPKSWEITHLVVRKGLVPHFALVPFSWISSISSEEIYIWGSNNDLKEVSVSQMQLELTWPSDASRENESYPLDENLMMSETVLNALSSDPRTSSSVIDVIYERGVVTLTGEVDNEQIHTAAEEIAHQQTNVLSVVNALEVRPKPDAVDVATNAFGQLVGNSFGTESSENPTRRIVNHWA